MFKVFLKSGPSFLKSGPRWEKSLKIGKNACPRIPISLLLAVNIIHDVITTPNPFPYTAKFMFVGVRNNETQQIRR